MRTVRALATLFARGTVWTPAIALPSAAARLGDSSATRGFAVACCRARAPPIRVATSRTTTAGPSGRSSTGCCGTPSLSLLGYSSPSPTSATATSLTKSPRPWSFAEYFRPFLRNPRSARRSCPGRAAVGAGLVGPPITGRSNLPRQHRLRRRRARAAPTPAAGRPVPRPAPHTYAAFCRDGRHTMFGETPITADLQPIPYQRGMLIYPREPRSARLV